MNASNSVNSVKIKRIRRHTKQGRLLRVSIRLCPEEFSPLVGNYGVYGMCGEDAMMKQKRCICTRRQRHQGPHVSFNGIPRTMNCSPWVVVE